ncbi:alpha-hydroxy-acid oxidizing protein [Actinokineospora sp. PR83]|uniref:alpha-hydroxy acid oxidase n=1 Tax=Actinokineospora sp. PR83 TaxID=2884908 RepID=UPI0027DFAAEF|nr:alpha-hydroxy acid oxidase [Actinokineospora sp. PR83]MCG8918146.1 alpha-hydroxy-acid oxidizing protein [Actinokineospora sp. PR83]
MTAVEPHPALTSADVEAAWCERTPAPIRAYVEGGAGGNSTVAGNADAFSSVWLTPRGVRTGADEPDTATTLLGHVLASPVVLAPTSPQRLLHPDAELAVARAATARGVLSVVSTDTHHRFPDIAAASPGLSWFQLYGYRSREHVAETVAYAERGGASAPVVTVDASDSARRVSTWRAGFRLPDDVDYGTLRDVGVLDGAAPASGRLDRLPVTWADIARLRALTSLPLLVKGVLRPEDAGRCVALALGADAVCLGRPYRWGLGLDGERGVGQVLDLVDAEPRDCLRQLGVATTADLDRSFLTPARPVLT